MYPLRNAMALAAALVVAAGGCSKEQRTHAAEEAQTPGAITGRYATSETIARAKKRTVNVSIFPKDTEALLSVRVYDFAKGPVSGALRQGRDENKFEFAKILSLCKIDLFRDVHTLTLGGSFTGGNRGAALVQGSFSQDTVTGCVKKLAKEHEVKNAVRREGALTVYKLDAETFYAAWLGTGSVLVGTEREHINDLLARKSLLDDNIKLGEVLREADKNASVWAAALMPSDLMGLGLLGTRDVQMQASYLNLFYKSGAIKLQGGLLTGSSEQAKGVAEQLKTLVKSAMATGKFQPLSLASLRIDTKGSFATASLTVSSSDLKKLLALLQSSDEADNKANETAPSEN